MNTPLHHRVAELLAAGWNKQKIANELGITRPKVQRIARKLGTPPRNDAMEAITSAADALRSVFANGERVTEARVPRLIQTEAEALEAAQIDLAVWEPVRLETRHYPMYADGQTIQGSYVRVACRKRTLENDPARIVAAVERGLAEALPKLGLVTPRAAIRYTRPQVLRTRIITDLHFGGYAWDKSTGGTNWDIARASATAFAANRYLDAQVPDDATETLLAFLGDVFHYDTPGGTTTGGTQLDLDSRVDLMLAAASDYAVTTVAEEAEKRPVTVLLVEGNHDKILSKALRRMLLIAFFKHKNVTVRECYTPRQYHRFGATLQGFAHGDANRQRIVDAMADDCGRLGIWDGATCREFHMGHVHHESAKQKVLWGAESLQGTVVRTHIALTPKDQYHEDNAWGGGSGSGMSDWYYSHKGAMIGNRVAVSHMLEAA